MSKHNKRIYKVIPYYKIKAIVYKPQVHEYYEFKKKKNDIIYRLILLF